MPTYQGGCHCGAVRFEVTRPTPIASVVECDCSLCTRKGILHSEAEDDQFRILKGEAELADYQFGTRTAHHWFCRHCGIHVFGRPRSAPERYTINARCFDDFRKLLPGLTVRPFDGINHFKDRQA